MLLFLEVHNAPPAGRRFEVEGLNLSQLLLKWQGIPQIKPDEGVADKAAWVPLLYLLLSSHY